MLRVKYSSIAPWAIIYYPEALTSDCLYTNLDIYTSDQQTEMTLDDAKFLAIAYDEAKAGYDEGGIPVSDTRGPCLNCSSTQPLFLCTAGDLVQVADSCFRSERCSCQKMEKC